MFLDFRSKNQQDDVYVFILRMHFLTCSVYNIPHGMDISFILFCCFDKYQIADAVFRINLCQYHNTLCDPKLNIFDILVNISLTNANFLIEIL